MMLSYIVLCFGLLYVQAQENCRVKEIIRKTEKLLEEDFENCNCSQINSCLCLPTKWNGCELSCFVDGFQRMKETFNVNTEMMVGIQRSLRVLKAKRCANLQSCKDPCLPTATGNVKEFLTGVKTAFQKVQKENGK